MKYIKAKILNVWLICTLTFVSSLNAQALSNVDERVEASVDQPDEPGSKKNKQSKKGIEIEETSNEKPEKIYLVSGFSLSYGKEHIDLPTVEQLGAIELNLNLEDGVYSLGSKGDMSDSRKAALANISIGSIPEGAKFTGSALQQVLTSIVGYFNDLDYYGVYATYTSESIDPNTGVDRRKNKDEDLEITIWCSEVVQVRTIGKGSRFSPEESIENKKHQKIRKHSPLSGRNEGQEGSLLSKSKMENYLQRLSRYPGRQVDVAISSSGEPGEIVLDYLVNENKPYVFYTQVSNTGVESTGDWRERIGFINYQLTNNDDKFSLDYVTAEFDQANSVLGSYEIPILYPDYLKVRAFGAWSEYDGDEVGLNSGRFSGETVAFGIELVSAPFVYNNFNFDLTVGFRWSDIEVINRSTNLEGDTQVWIPYLGVAMSRKGWFGSVNASLTAEGNWGSVDKSELSGPLGRGNLDADWQWFKGHFHGNVFLEPLIFGADWNDRSSWQSSTLAHELDFKFRFQRTLGEDRVIPQETFIAGGFTSVRGYRESVASGDSGIIMNLEYRYHLPRSLKPHSEIKAADGSPGVASKLLNHFNLRPPYVYGLPDWDLILRSFVDYGYTNVNEKTFGEENLTMASTGVGVELRMLSNLNIRLDWGVVLNTLERSGVEIDDAESGDSRFHFISTLSW